MDGVRPKGLTWDKSDSTVIDANGAETALRTESNADRAGEQRKGQRERTDSDLDWRNRTRDRIFTVVYYGHGCIYTTKTCGLPVTSVLHQVRWSVRAWATCCADYAQMAGLSLQQCGWWASARRFDTDARGIAEAGNQPNSALSPNVAGTGTLQWYTADHSGSWLFMMNRSVHWTFAYI